MALETRIPKEITEYREKIVFGMSGRQLVAIAAAVAVVGLTAFVLWHLMGVNFSIVEYILILEALPFVAFGFLRPNGMPFEQFARIRLNHRFDAKRLLNKTSLDFLPSLYPLSPETGSKTKGANREETTHKEKRSRKKQRECLCGAAKARKRRPHFAAKAQREAQG